MKSVWIVPTRGRPANARRLARRWLETTTQDTHLLFIIDDDDPELENYTKTLMADEDINFGLPVSWNVAQRRRVGPTLNHWATKLAETYDAVGFMGDDHLPHPGWTVMLDRVAAWQTRNFICYGNDLFQRGNLPTAVLMDSRIIRTLGYMVPPGLTHLYLDNFWRDLGQELGTLSYHPDVIIEHMHPQAQKAEWDDGYREVNGGEMWAADAATYTEYVESGALVAAVKALGRDA